MDETEFPHKRMTTKPKMKGIFKGFKYISHIFEEGKEDEIQIGFPTDVKHVAHIGWNGPTVDCPSWMKEFSASTGIQSAPLGPPTGDPTEVKWVSEDSSARRSRRGSTESEEDVRRSSRRHQSPATTEGNANELSSPRKKDSSTRQRRRNHSSEGSLRSSNRHVQDPSDSPSPPNMPSDTSRRSRRKKSRDLGAPDRDGSSRSRSKPTTSADNPPDKDSVIDNDPEPQLDPIRYNTSELKMIE